MVTSAAAEKPKRYRAATEQRILRAVGSVLSERGFHGLGLRAIARQAGVDKVLIYRYFGGLPELLAAFARTAEFWPEDAEILRGAEKSSLDLAEPSASMLKQLLRGLLARPMTQEVLRWELAASNELTEKLADVREEQGLRMLSSVGGIARELDASVDVPAIAALLSAGITYLVLRSKSAPRWLGVSLQDERGWKRVERAAETIVRRVLRSKTSSRRKRA